VTAAARLLCLLVWLPGQFVVRLIDRRKIRNGVPPLNAFLRGSVHVFTWFFVLVVLVAVAPDTTPSSSIAAADDTVRPPTSSDVQVAQTVPYRADVPVLVAGEQVTVSRVIDGDTFETSDGRTVRVLGIDSCEKGTPGGLVATNDALNLLTAGKPVHLRTEPGVTTDRYGRHLRYVQAGGQDFGTFMVGWDHTGVYQGSNDASSAYVASLYSNDLNHAKNPPAGRDCGETVPAAPADDSDPVYVPSDDDDDDDGRESRFCRGKWWC
jgi:endonuclease YncB( thermonuclease family)